MLAAASTAVSTTLFVQNREIIILRSFGWWNLIALFITFALLDQFGSSVRDYIAKAVPTIFADIIVIIFGFIVLVILSAILERVPLRKR